MERVINMIGLGKSAAMAPDTGENWVLCNAYKREANDGKFVRADKWFYMDDYKDIVNGDSYIEPVDRTIIEFIKDNPNMEIISRLKDEIFVVENVRNEKNEIVPGNKTKLADVKPYPLNEAIDLINGAYFTSTIAYMICYAIMQKVDRIRLYGFECWSKADANEYEAQRPCIDFWLSHSMGKGIRVEIPYYLIHAHANCQNYYGYIQGELKYNYGR